MRHDETSASILARLTGRPHVPQPVDFGDHGTAFGLELSMAGGVPHAVDAPAPPRPVPPPAAGWLARWRRR